MVDNMEIFLEQIGNSFVGLFKSIHNGLGLYDRIIGQIWQKISNMVGESDLKKSGQKGIGDEQKNRKLERKNQNFKNSIIKID